MDYKARFYSPYLNRFIQPDTLIPDPSNPQAYNRYSYVYGNPLKFVDPSGHDPRCGPDGIFCGYEESYRTDVKKSPSCDTACQFGLKFEGDWDGNDKKAFMNAVEREAERMYDVYCPERFRFECEFDSPADLYQATHGTTTLTFVKSSQGFFCQRNSNTGQEGVSCYKNSRGNIDPILGAHEMGHVFNALIANNGHTDPYTDMALARSRGGLPDIDQAITTGYMKNSGSNGEDFANTYSMWVFDAFPDTHKGDSAENLWKRICTFG